MKTTAFSLYNVELLAYLHSLAPCYTIMLKYSESDNNKINKVGIESRIVNRLGFFSYFLLDLQLNSFTQNRQGSRETPFD